MKELLPVVIDSLREKYEYKNIHQVPKIEKVVLNIGCGEASSNPKIVESCVYVLTCITGQKPVVRKARKSIAGFKLRQGAPIGVSVTLRGDRMWNFLQLLVSVALPRVRDFRGLSRTAFDGRGNYSIGVKEQIVFPQVDIDRVEARTRGLGIQVVTSACSNDEARTLLAGLGFPFRA